MRTLTVDGCRKIVTNHSGKRAGSIVRVTHVGREALIVVVVPAMVGVGGSRV